MKTLESGQDKIQKICDKLRHETLEPAKEEAAQIIKAARKKADEILANAESQSEQMLKQAKSQIEQERTVFQSSLQQSSKQALESLRQEIEQRLFNEELQSILDKNLSDPKMIADLINGIVKALEKDGIKANLTAVIPKTVSAEQVNALLLDHAKNKLQGHPIELGKFGGGVQVKLQGKRMIIDLTSQALQELLMNYAGKNFRHTLFNHH